MSTELETTLRKALNKLSKWRGVFASWQLGTRSGDDAETRAVKDHRELSIMLRAEVNAITGLLVEKGVFTTEEFQRALLKEARQLDADYEKFFPGFFTSDTGIVINVEEAAKTTANWRK